MKEEGGVCGTRAHETGMRRTPANTDTGLDANRDTSISGGWNKSRTEIHRKALRNCIELTFYFSPVGDKRRDSEENINKK